MLCMLALAVAGACGVVLAGELLAPSPRVHRWRTGYRLATAHTLVVLGFMALSPLVIWMVWGSPYGDLYVPYFFVPGTHIDHLANQVFKGPVSLWLRGHMASFPASVLCIIVGPGLIGILLGGFQWFLIGVVRDRLLAEQEK